MPTKNKNITTLQDHLTRQYGDKGIAKRVEFEIKVKAFLIGAVIK